jgi:hypothetical protein
LITYADRPVYRAQHNPGVTEGGKQEAAEKMEGPGHMIVTLRVLINPTCNRQRLHTSRQDYTAGSQTENMLITYADRPVYRAQHNPGVTEGGKQEAAEKMDMIVTLRVLINPTCNRQRLHTSRQDYTAGSQTEVVRQ